MKFTLMLLAIFTVTVMSANEGLMNNNYYEDGNFFNYDILQDYLSNSNGSGEMYTQKDAVTASDIAFATIYITFTVVGLLANGVVMFVVFCGNEITKTITAIYVVQLAVADCAFLITLPFFAIQHLKSSANHFSSSAICTFCQSMKYINYYAGIFFLTAMSIDRYIAVVYSTKSRQIRTTLRTMIVCIGVWAASVLASLPVMMYAQLEQQESYNMCVIMFPGYKKYNQSEYSPSFDDIIADTVDEPAICERENEPEAHRIYDVFRFLVGYLLPFMVITVNYILILIKLRRSEKKLSEANKKSTQTNSIRHKVTMMVIALVICFGVCWLPYQIYTMMLLKGFPISSGKKWDCFVIERYLAIIGYSNSVLNPLLYTFLGHNFRKRLLDSWKNTRSRVQHGSRMLTKGQWRNTAKFHSTSVTKRFSGLQFSRLTQAKTDQAGSSGFTTVPATEHEKDGKKTALLELQTLDQPETSSKMYFGKKEIADHV